MILIPLLDGRTGEKVGETIVDDVDSSVAAFTWRLGRTGYAVRWRDGGTVYLHRDLLGLARGDAREVDHRNRDKLDNRRSNLRVVTRRENAQNLPSQRGTSGFRGVARTAGGRWTAQVKLDGRKRHLGTFATEGAAAAAAAAFRRAHMPHSIEGAA